MSQLEDALAAQIRLCHLPEFVREYRFAKPRRWRFDFAWPEYMIACEVEGGIWNGGRHATGVGISGDCEKASEAAILGWRVLRVTGDQIKRGEALNWLERVLLGKQTYRKAEAALPTGRGARLSRLLNPGIR